VQRGDAFVARSAKAAQTSTEVNRITQARGKFRMNRRLRWTALNRAVALILMAGSSLSIARLHGQAPRPAVKPAAPQQRLAPQQQLAPQQSSRLAAGPTYTSVDGKGAPKFPQADIVFALTGAEGRPITPRFADLQLFSQGKQIANASGFRTYEQTGYPVASILAIDASGSMKGAPLNAIHASIAKFVGQARTQDKVAVVTFADDTLTDVPFNHSQSQMTAELQTVKARGHTTHLWDGLLYAIDQYKLVTPTRRLLVVISDGHDEGSRSTLNDVIRKATENGVAVSAIGLTRDHGEYLKYLQQLSSATGGSYDRAMSPADLDRLIGDGIAAQRKTPVASFDVSHMTADGKKQNIEVRWLPGKLSAPASIQTFKPEKTPTKVDRLWIWGLGGCFVAGIILLAVSWRSSRRKPMPVEPLPAAGANFAAPPPPVPFSPSSAPPPAIPFTPVSDFDPHDRPAGSVLRSPTIDESEYLSRPAKQYVPTEDPQRIETMPKPTPPPRNRSRNMTQLAGVFDAPERGPYARLQIKTGALAGTGVLVTAANFTIGALDSNHLVLPGDPTISGRHARLLWEGGILKAEDNQSTNGTYLNGLRLEPGRHVVRPGDEIRVGKAVLLLTLV
jgi:uncharacterized protein YegL